MVSTTRTGKGGDSASDYDQQDDLEHIRLRYQMITDSWYSPKTLRRASEISPTVA